jgi:hypothetical protein
VPPKPVPPPQSALQLDALQPGRGAVVTGDRPTISANFTQRANPNSLRVTLDGLDITAGTTRSQTGIVYAPPSPLQPVRHTVQVVGTDIAGARFERSWTFTSGKAPPAGPLKLSQPKPGAAVDATFNVVGTARPRSRVRITATSDRALVPPLPAATFTGETVAGGTGVFSRSVTLRAASGRPIQLTVVATDPATGDASQVKLTLRAR